MRPNDVMGAMIQVWMLVGMLIAYAAIGVFARGEIDLWLARRRMKRMEKFTVEVLNELADMLRSRLDGEDVQESIDAATY